jgi:hypothetical protein
MNKTGETEITLQGVAVSQKRKWRCGHQKKDCPQLKHDNNKIINRISVDGVARQGTKLPSAGGIRKMQKEDLLGCERS